MATRKRPPGDKNLPAHWLDAKGVRRCLPIHRTKPGRLVETGEIRTVPPREPGCRRGVMDAAVERLLRPRVSLFPERGITGLFARNPMVDRWNDFRLAELPGPESVREAETRDPQSQTEFLEKNLLSRGRGVEVAPFGWRHDSRDSASAWFGQLPLRLAWAITIHRRQELLLDAALVDIRAAREPGQAYVALSRVRTVDDLHPKDWPKGVFVSERALAFHFPKSQP